MIMKKMFLTVIFSLLLLVITGMLFLFLYTPDVSWLKSSNPKTTPFMELAKSKPNKADIKHIYVPFDKIHPHIRNAVYLSEDAGFWAHQGIDWYELRQSFMENFRKKKIKRGGSTITQQLAKNLFLSPEKSLFRKIKEFFYARALEKHLSKNRIFELYLNYAQFGPHIFGVEAATREFFHHPADSVSVMEASMLAAVLPAPSRLSPTKPSYWLEKRTRHIIDLMKKFEKISTDEYIEAMSACDKYFFDKQKEGEKNEFQTTD